MALQPISTSSPQPRITPASRSCADLRGSGHLLPAIAKHPLAENLRRRRSACPPLQHREVPKRSADSIANRSLTDGGPRVRIPPLQRRVACDPDFQARKSPLAYNLGNFMRDAGDTQDGGRVVADQPAREADQDWREGRMQRFAASPAHSLTIPVRPRSGPSCSHSRPTKSAKRTG